MDSSLLEEDEWEDISSSSAEEGEFSSSERHQWETFDPKEPLYLGFHWQHEFLQVLLKPYQFTGKDLQ